MSNDTNTTAATTVIPGAFEWQAQGLSHLRTGKSGAIWQIPTGHGKDYLALKYGQEVNRLRIFAPNQELMRQLEKDAVRIFGRKNVRAMNRESGFDPQRASRAKGLVGSCFAPPALMQHLGAGFSDNIPVAFIDEVDRMMGSEEVQLLMGRVFRKNPRTRFVAMSGSLHENDIKPLCSLMRARKVIRQANKRAKIHRHVVLFNVVKEANQPVQTDMVVSRWETDRLVPVYTTRINREITNDEKAAATAEVLRYIREQLGEKRPVLAYSRRQADSNMLIRQLLENPLPWFGQARSELLRHMDKLPKGETPNITLFRESFPKGMVPVHANVHPDCRRLAQDMCETGELDLIAGCVITGTGTNFVYGAAVIMTAEDQEFGLMSASEHEQVLGRISRPDIKSDGSIEFPDGNCFVVVFSKVMQAVVAKQLLNQSASEIDAKITNINKLAPYLVEWIQEGFNTRAKLLKCMQRFTLWGKKGAGKDALLKIIDDTIENLITEHGMLEKHRRKRASTDYFTVTEWGEQLSNLMTTPIELAALRLFTEEEAGDHRAWVEALAELKKELSNQGKDAWSNAVDDAVAYGLLNHGRTESHRFAGQLADYAQRMADLGFIFLQRRKAPQKLIDAWRDKIAVFCLNGTEFYREDLSKLPHPMRKRLLRRCGSVLMNPMKSSVTERELVVKVAFETLQEEPSEELMETLANLLFLQLRQIQDMSATIRGTVADNSKEKAKQDKPHRELKGGGSSGGNIKITLDDLVLTEGGANNG